MNWIGPILGYALWLILGAVVAWMLYEVLR